MQKYTCLTLINRVFIIRGSSVNSNNRSKKSKRYSEVVVNFLMSSVLGVGVKGTYPRIYKGKE